LPFTAEKAYKNRCFDRNAVVGSTPQRSAAFSIVTPSFKASAYSTHSSFFLARQKCSSQRIEVLPAMVETLPLKAFGSALPSCAMRVTPETAYLISSPFFSHVGAGSLRVLGRSL
jgi:hypothetical protein